jgi:hypothetical protein
VTTGKKSIPGTEHVVSSVRIFIPFLFHGEGVDEKCFSEGKKNCSTDKNTIVIISGSPNDVC